MPLNRPASAIGWAYPPAGEQARRQASLGAAGAPARARAVARPPSAVPEDAEVVEVFARAAAASGGAPLGEAYPGLPPSLARTLHHSGDDGAHGPPASGVPPVRNKAPQYNLLLPQSAATAATASLDANYQLRAKDAQSLYGDRACEGPTKAIRRGCLAPMGCSAPPRDSKEPNGGDELDDDEPGGHAGSEDQERSGGAGGLSMKTLSNSLSNLAAYFGVVHKSEILTAEEMAAAEAAQQRRALFMHEAAARKAAQQAQAYPAGPAHAPSRIDPVASAAAFLAQPPASEIRSQSIGVSRLQGLPSPAAPLHAVALDAESAAFAFEAAWKERQRLRDQGLSRSDADAVVMGLGSPYAQVVPPAGGTPDATSRVNVARHHLAVHVAPAPLPVHMRGDSEEEEEYGNVVAAPPVPAAALEPLRGRRVSGGAGLRDS